MNTYFRALTIAGSDSGGGAGIQADLKTFSALGCFGMSAITAITAQNTKGVTAIFPLPPSMLGEQLEAVLSDIGADAIKIGMLHSSEVISVVASVLKKYPRIPVVLDPVMTAKSGDKLLQDEAIASLKTRLLPLATVVTPNLPEASILLGRTLQTENDMTAAARELLTLGVQAAVVKGGHLQTDDSNDCYLTKQNETPSWLRAKRVKTKNTHGTGCTFSSAIAAYLAQKEPLDKAIHKAKEYIDAAIQAGAGYRIGEGHGPVHHFHSMWKQV